jgi:hypothetical protein
MSVPCSSGGLGNTNPVLSRNSRKCNPAKRWCFTLNNYSYFEMDQICSICSKNCKYAIIGKERAPNTGTLHLQGYLEFKAKKRPIGLFGNPCIHWELAKGNKNHNIAYCSKEDPNPWIYPKPWNFKLDKLYKWQDNICEILKEEPNDRTIHWVWESEGCAGKTSLQKHIYSNYKNVIVSCGKNADMKNGIIEYQKNVEELPKIVLINIPRSIKDYVSYAGIEEIKDMFFYSPKYEGGMICGPNPHVICFANEPPTTDKMSCDRWRIGEIIGDEISWE